MAQQETYKINVESNAAEVTKEVEDAVKDLKQSVDSVGDAANSSLNNLEKSAGKAADNIDKSASGMKDLAAESVDAKEGVDGAVTVLDQFTGGIAGMLVNVGRGFKAFGKQALVAFRTATAGATGLKKALITTGIGAIVVGVASLIVYWEEFVGWLGFGADETKKLSEAQEEYNKALAGAQGASQANEVSLRLYLGVVNDVTKAEEDRLFALGELKKAGIITEDIDLANAESLGILNQRVAKNIELTYARAQANAASQYLEKEMIKLYELEAEQREEVAEGIEMYLAMSQDLLMSGMAEYALNEGLKEQAEERERAEKNILRAKESYKEALEALMPLEGENLQMQEDTRNELERRAKTDEAVAQALRDREEAEKRAAAMYAETLKQLEVLRAEDGEKEIVRIKQNYEERIAMITAQYGAESQELKDLLELQGAEIQAVRDKQEEERQAKEDKAAEERKQKAKEESDFKKYLAEKEAGYFAQMEAEKYQMAKQGFEALGALSEAFSGDNEKQQRRNFQIQKALSAANVTVGTIEGAQNAYATAQKSPLTAVFPGYPIVQAGLATAFGIAQLQQIRKSQFQGGDPTAPSSAGGGAGTAMAGTTPSFNIVGGSGANVIAESLSKTPLKAYVVGSEVTTQQELDRKQIKSATL